MFQHPIFSSFFTSFFVVEAEAEFEFEKFAEETSSFAFGWPSFLLLFPMVVWFLEKPNPFHFVGNYKSCWLSVHWSCNYHCWDQRYCVLCFDQSNFQLDFLLSSCQLCGRIYNLLFYRFSSSSTQSKPLGDSIHSLHCTQTFYWTFLNHAFWTYCRFLGVLFCTLCQICTYLFIYLLWDSLDAYTEMI